jgi:hypothetical protein
VARSQTADGAKAQATITAVDTGDWTIAAFINPTDAGQSNVGRILQADFSGALKQDFRFSDASLHLAVAQSYSGGSAFSATSTAITASVWSAVFATFTAADKTTRVYIGTLSSAVAEAAYSSQSAGGGTRDTGGTRATVFNSGAGTGTFHGSLARVAFVNRLWRLDEMEAFRLGWVPPKDGNERGLWLFDSPTASQVEDCYGVANATATSLAVAEGPPVPTWQGGGLAVLAQAAAPVTDLGTGSTAITFAFSGTLTTATPVALASSLSITFAFSGTLTIPVALAGSLALTTGLSGSLTSGSNLQSFTADRTQGLNIRVFFFGTLTVPVAVESPPTSEFQNVRRVSPTMPTPSLDSQGRPINWQPSSVVDEDWGRLQVIINNTDVTYWNGIPCEVSRFVSNDPFDDAHAEIKFPLATSAPSWYVDYANVELVLVRPNGSTKVLWEGFVAAQQASQTQDEYALSLACQGALYQLDLFQHQPEFPGGQPVNDISIQINRQVFRASQYGSRIPPAAADGSFPDTGISSSAQGPWGKVLSGYIQDLLTKAVTNSPGYWTQWSLMKLTGRKPTMVLRDLATVHWTLSAGTPGAEAQLSRELTMAPNAIYGTGVSPLPDPCKWSNSKYPNLHPDTAPVWPGRLFTVGTVGAVNPGGSDTHGTTDVLLWKDRAAQLGFPVVAGNNTYTSQDATACRQLQNNYGILVDGVVGPQTWAATFDTGANGGDVLGAHYFPLSELRSVEPFLSELTSPYMASPDNPDFAANQPGLMRIEKFENFGQEVTKAEGVSSAADEIARHAGAHWTGDITLKIDPQEGSRFEMKAGQNVLWKTLSGNILLHIAQADQDIPNLTTKLTVDEGGRDLLTLSQVRARDRDTFDPVGRQKTVYYAQRKEAQVQQNPVFDCENGAGVIPYQGIFSRLWNVERIPFAFAGTIVRTTLNNIGAAEMAMGVFDGRDGFRPTHDYLRSFGEPTDPDYWINLPDTLGLIVAWGGNGQMMGYYPKLQSTVGAPKTGAFTDNASWYYECKYPPWLWVAIWCESTTYLSGQFFNEAPA